MTKKVVAAFSLALILSAHALAGVVIELENRDMAADSATPSHKIFADGEMLRMEVQEGGEDTTMIFRDNVIYIVNHQDESYFKLDEAMMEELRRIKERIKPHETILVADGMTGQDAVTIASEFGGTLDIDGVILTKMDGDERGGAALSIRAVSGAPIRYIGVGEKLDALEVFHPERMASRILGMGDVLTLVEKAQDAIDSREATRLQEKILKETFTLEDFLGQIKQMKKMGPLEDIVGMLPGFSKMKGIDLDEKALTRVEAIINSMTVQERRNPKIVDGSRRRRVASGSGTTVQEVNALLKQFGQVKKMMKNLSKLGRVRGAGPLSSFKL